MRIAKSPKANPLYCVAPPAGGIEMDYDRHDYGQRPVSPCGASHRHASRPSMRLRSFAALFLLMLGGAALADYPDKPIRFIVPSAAGGSPDVLMRILTAELSKRLGVQFVILNKPGANAVIGTMEIVNAPPDGYTLGYGNIVSLAIVHGPMADVPYRNEDLTLTRIACASPIYSRSTTIFRFTASGN
ncbi:MAG: tripartite tricarboxylate transporter substrate-binding protein [Betaproteobacteria bacterium]